MWSASARFPHEVRSEIPLASFERSVFTSCARGLGHPAHVTDRTAWEMREHMMISLWFGTAGSLDPKNAFLRDFIVSVSLRIAEGSVAAARGSPLASSG